MFDATVTLANLRPLAIRILQNTKRRLIEDHTWLREGWMLDLQGNPTLNPNIAVVFTRSTIQPGTHFVYRLVVGQLVDQLLYQACGMDAEDWARTPGRLLSEVHNALDQAADNPRSHADNLTAWTGAHRIFTVMKDLLACHDSWLPGRETAGAVRAGQELHLTNALLTEVNAWTTPGAFARAVLDARNSIPDTIHHLYGILVAHQLTEDLMGTPDLEEPTNLTPHTYEGTLVFLNQALDQAREHMVLLQADPSSSNPS